MQYALYREMLAVAQHPDGVSRRMESVGMPLIGRQDLLPHVGDEDL
jgi:hypothetical protein